MQFKGYKRPDGSVGIRNHVVIIPAVTCANEMAYRLSELVSGTVPLCHMFGCIYGGEDRIRGRKCIVGLGANPNVYAALVVGVGCEAYSTSMIVKEIAKTGKPVKGLVASNYDDLEQLFEEGKLFLEEMVAAAAEQEREDCDVSSLTIALKCGGSGAISLLSNNPAVGKAVDRIVAEGGTAILSETAELIGAESMLSARAISEKVACDLRECVGKLQREIERHGIDILGSEPTSGNIISGLTTIEEKSLGSVAKGGTSPLMGVLDYADKPDGKGLYFMDSEAAAGPVFAGMIAAGAQIAVYSLAGGIQAKFGSMPSFASGIVTLPTIKVLGSSENERQKPYFDAYCGDVLTGKMSLDEAGDQVLHAILNAASGEKTYTEAHAHYNETIRFYTNGLVM